MPILKEDVKLMESERMDDTEYGGGRMTGTEVESGKVNAMFKDISRLDRVKGRVSMMKGFVGAFTDNNDTYSGAHVIMTEPASDPLVFVSMFTTDNPYDIRREAQDRVESYVVQGSRFPGYLWGKHIEGARAVSIIQELTSEPPGVGDVLFIEEEERYQYVRITDVTITPTFFENKGTKNVVACGISDPLRNDFFGYEPSEDSRVHRSMVYKTLVADAAQYFGVMNLTSEIAKNSTSLRVDSIYTHLVPSAQSETPVVDVTSGNVATICTPDNDVLRSIGGVEKAGGGETLHFPVGALPGSLSVRIGSYNWYSEGINLFDSSGEIVGSIDYGNTSIAFNPDAAVVSGNGTVSYIPAYSKKRIGNSKALPVLIANRGYNYVTSLLPLPAPGSIVVDFMAEGKWYTLYDDGAGGLRGEANSGSGSINYATGSIIVTCGALPDANSAILVNWGAPNEIVYRGNKVLTSDYDIRHTVEAGTIAPGSLEIKWWHSGTEYTATDDGAGNITGDNAGGIVLYGKGEIRFKPTVAPEVGSTIVVNSNSISTVTENKELTAGNNSFTLSQFPIKPGTFSIRSDYTGHGHTMSILIEDNGSGGLVFNDGVIQLNKALGHGSWEGSTSITPMAVGGTINYATGEVFFYGLASGIVNWIEVTMTTKTISI